MQNRLKKILLLMLTFAFVVAYAQNNNANAKSDFNDPAKPIIVQKSAPDFTIRLKSNPTTGYSWFVKSYDAKYIKPIDHKFIPPTRRMPGAAGYQEWVFKAKPAAFKKPTMTKIRLVYMRPWEKQFVQDVTFKIVTK